MADNLFDLTKIISKKEIIEKPTYKPDIITTEEWKLALTNYEKVPELDWLKQPIGAHIRYVRKDGEPRMGGYVRLIDHAKNQLYLSKFPIDIGNSKGWKLPLSGVAEIWTIKKQIPQKAPDIHEEINSMRDDIEQLKKNVQNINNQQKRILDFLKKLKAGS